MAKCENCGKKGLFLKLNARGLCPECAELAKNSPRSGMISFGVGVNISKENASFGHKEEENACQYFINELVKRGKDASRFSIKHQSQEYTSLFYDLDDFIRIKITSNVKWISISLSETDRQKYENSKLFSAQMDKAQRHWRSDFHSVDSLSQYIELAERACLPTTFSYSRSLTERETAVADYLMQLFIKCGADPEKFYCNIYSQEAELIYNSQFGNIKFKAYAKKTGGYIITDRDFEEVKVKAEKNRIAFTDLSELDFLQEKLIPVKIRRGLDSKYSADMKYYIKYPINPS